MSSVTDAAERGLPGLTKLIAYVELGKVRLSSLAIFAVLAGIYLGQSVISELPPSVDLVVAIGIGSMLVAMGGSALNQYLERDIDPKMARTSGRPLPTGRVTPTEVLVVGFGAAAIGLATIAAASNLLATLLSATIFVLYVFVYTPLKRVTTLNTIVGAVPGALPPVVGYAAATGRVDQNAWLLFLIVFLWQIPHFLAIAWRYRNDYRAGGLKMLAEADVDGRVLRRQMLVYTIALIVTSFLPYRSELVGQAYLGVAALLGLLFLVPVLLASVLRWESAMRPTFIASIIYLPLLFGAMVLDRL